MCQASSRTGFQSDVHHHRSFGPHGATARQQNITADMATAQGEQRRRVESKGNIPLCTLPLLKKKKQQRDSQWFSETLTGGLQREYTMATFSPCSPTSSMCLADKRLCESCGSFSRYCFIVFFLASERNNRNVKPIVLALFFIVHSNEQNDCVHDAEIDVSGSVVIQCSHQKVN